MNRLSTPRRLVVALLGASLAFASATPALAVQRVKQDGERPQRKEQAQKQEQARKPRPAAQQRPAAQLQRPAARTPERHEHWGDAARRQPAQRQASMERASQQRQQALERARQQREAASQQRQASEQRAQAERRLADACDGDFARDGHAGCPR